MYPPSMDTGVSLPRAMWICCLIGVLLTGCSRGVAAPTATASPIAPRTLPLIGVSLPDVASNDITLIQKALARATGNVSEAAKALGLSRSALYRRLKRHGF